MLCYSAPHAPFHKNFYSHPDEQHSTDNPSFPLERRAEPAPDIHARKAQQKGDQADYPRVQQEKGKAVDIRAGKRYPHRQRIDARRHCEREQGAQTDLACIREC